MWRKNCVLQPAVGKQNATSSPNLTQPGKVILVQPCTLVAFWKSSVLSVVHKQASTASKGHQSLPFDQESGRYALGKAPSLLYQTILCFSKPLISLTEGFEWSIDLWLVNHSKCLNGLWMVNQSQIPHPNYQSIVQVIGAHKTDKAN